MMSKRLLNAIAAFVTILAFGALATLAVGQEREKRHIPEGFGKPPIRTTPERGPRDRVCHSIFEFKYAYGTHWEVGQKFGLLGPLPYGGDMIMVTLPSTPTHETKLGAYLVTNVSVLLPPTIYLVNTRVKGGSHSAETFHPQLMFVEGFGRDDCPMTVSFASEFDIGDDGDHHGGHAGASNW